MTHFSTLLIILLTSCGKPAGDCDPGKFDDSSCPVGTAATCEYSRDISLDIESEITVEHGTNYDISSDIAYVLAEDHSYYCEAIQTCDEEAGYQPHMTNECYGCATLTDEGIESPCDT